MAITDPLLDEEFESFDLNGDLIDEPALSTEPITEPDRFMVPTDESLDTALDNAFPKLASRIKGNPTFGALEWEDPKRPGGVGGTTSAVQDEEFEDINWTPSGEVPEEGKPGYLSNIARLSGQRGLQLIGSGLRAGGEVGEDINEGLGLGRFVWGTPDGKGFRYVSAEEFKELEDKHGVSENLLTETLPMAFQDRDLGGEKTSSPERIKEGWKNGDAIEVAAATGTFIAETFIESVPDMLAVVWSLPIYAIARSEEIGEERVRNERLSEALAADPELDAQAQAQLASGYVQPEEISTEDIAKAAPFAALSAALERVGAKGIASAGTKVPSAVLANVAEEATEYGFKYALKEGTKAGTREASTEFFQEGFLEYLGEKMGTGADLSVGEGVERGAWAALAGYGGGQVAGTATAGARSLFSRETDIDPETGKPVLREDDGTTPPTPPTDVTPPVVDETTDADVEAEGEDVIVEPPPPEQEQATTPADTPITETPVALEGEPTEVIAPEEQVVTQDDLVTEPTPVEEAAAESPLIDAKTLAPKITKTINDNEKPGPVRSAWRGLMQTIAKRYSDADLPVPARTFSGTGIAKFFKALQDQVDITEDIPDVKAFLDELATGEPADVIRTLERLKSHVQGTTPSLADAPIDSIAGQAQAVYNDFTEYYETHQRESKAKKTKGQITLKGSAIAMANKLGELAGVTRQLLAAAYDAGVLEEAGIGANYGKTIEIAEQAADAAQSPIEKKTASGGKTKGITFARQTLFKNAQELKEIVEKVTPLLAAAEARGDKAKAAKAAPTVDKTIKVSKPTVAKKPDTKAKAAQSTPVTKPVSKPKKAEEGGTTVTSENLVATSYGLFAVSEPKPEAKGEAKPEKAPKAAKAVKVSKAKAEKKAAPQKLSVEDRKVKAELKAAETARVDKVVVVAEAGDKNATADAVWDMGTDLYAAPINKLRKMAKALGIKTVGKKADLQDNILEAANNQRIDRQKESMAAEDAEIKAEVEKHVPKKFRKKHVFHAVRDIKDVAAIVKAGLKKGTNLALDIMGQGVSMMGDAGNVVLVFADDTKAYTVKDYQNDGVAKGGMKPVAIVADSLTKEQIATLGKTGLPVYVGGKRVSAKGQAAKKPAKKAAKKPDVKDAPPAEVFDREQNITGAEAAAMKKAMDAETLDEAFEKAGVSKSSATKIRGLMGVLDKAGKLELTKIAEEFNRTGDMIRFATQVKDLVGRVPSPALMEAYTEFFVAINEQEAAREPTFDDAMDAIQDDYADMTEDERAIAELTGAIEPRIDEQETTLDEFGVAWSERLRSLYNLLGGKILGKSNAVTKADNRILQRAWDKLRGQLEGVETIKTGEFIDMMLKVLPSNHRFAHLLQQVKKSNLDLEITITNKADEIIQTADGTSHSKAGGKFTANYASPENSTIEILTNENRSGKVFFRTATHELLHAVTVFRYATDTNFRRRMDGLWKKTVLKLLSNSSQFDPAHFEDLTATNANAAYDYILQFLMNEPGDIDARTVNSLYGLTSPKEFMAEAFTNIDFQETLAGIKTEPRAGLTYLDTAKSFLKVFINEIKKMLDMSIRNTVLEEVLILAANNFDTAASYSAAASNISLQEAVQRGVLKRNRAEFGPPTMTGMTARALSLKDYAKSIIKAVKTDTSTDEEAISAGGQSTRNARIAIELLNDGLAAVENGKGHVLQDHLERAISYLLQVDKKFLQSLMDRDPRMAGIIAGSLSDESLASVQIEEGSIPDKKVRSTVVNDTADAARLRDSKLKQAFETLADRLKSLPRDVNLGFMNRDVIERNYRELFARASKAAGHLVSPLTVYIKSKQAASRLAEKFALRATAALQKMQKLDNKTRSQVFAMMRDTTLAQVWPHVSLRSKENAHLWSKPNKKNVSKLSPELGEAAKKARKEWLTLNKKNPEAANILIEMAMLTKEIQDRKRIEALQTVGKTYEVDESIIKKLAQLETKEDIQKMFPGMYDKDGDLIPDTKDTRPADTLKEKGDSKEVKKEKAEKLKAWREMRSIARTAEEIVKGTSIKGPYFPLRRYGKYVVSSTEEHNEDGESYVSFHHTRKEAKRVAAALQKKHGIPTYVTKKAESMTIPRDVESVTSELASRLEGNKEDHMHQRLKTAMIEIMADNTAYASQLKRHGVDGVAADDMGRAFEEYVFVAKYTLGDLATSYEVHQALKDLKELQTRGVQDALRQEGVTDEEALLVGDVVNELAAQNKEDAKDREMSGFQKGVGLIGFFNFLGAPSYWVLNATQTLTVTLPYLGSKWGVKGTTAYTDSAGTIFKAVQAALKSGDKSYEGFKAQLPPAAQKVVAELEAQGIIQSTIAHQFGDIMTPSTLTSIQEFAGPVGKATATALKLMETIPEGVEKYNRISTALAIYNLSDGDMIAVADGVQATQFNYDSANRARLMKAAPKWAGGGLRALITPMMMFKSYGIGVTRLLYGGAMNAMITRRPHESAEQAATRRTEGLKVAGGLIVSHSVFAGVAGGLMTAPVQALIWAFNAAFREAGDEFDPEEAVELYLQDVANDTVAALVSRGVPAALGIDMSKSINLGNLIWMGNDRLNLGDEGGVEKVIAAGLGPVAQWGITSVREGARIYNEDPRGNWYDFAAAALPLKMARGTIRGLKYEMEGVGTDTLTFIKPEDVTGWIRSAMGFRPTSTVMVTDYEYNQMGREARRSSRKSALIIRAMEANTSSKRAAVWEEIESFNRSLERRGDWIRRGDVARLKSGRRSRQRQYDRERR